jgi:hypothetical protein
VDRRRWALLGAAFIVIALGVSGAYYYAGWMRFQVSASSVRPAGPCPLGRGACVTVRLTNGSHRDAWTRCQIDATDGNGTHHDVGILVGGSI